MASRRSRSLLTVLSSRKLSNTRLRPVRPIVRLTKENFARQCLLAIRDVWSAHIRGVIDGGARTTSMEGEAFYAAGEDACMHCRVHIPRPTNRELSSGSVAAG